MKLLYLLFFISFLACRDSPKNTKSVGGTDSSTYKATEALVKKKAEPAYIKAYTEVNELKINIKLAEEGTLPEKGVISQYNRTVGQTMGKLNKLSDVKTRIDTAGESYIQFMWNKEAARIALEMAAEKKLEVERLQKQPAGN